MKIAVLGANGHLGSAIVSLLRSPEKVGLIDPAHSVRGFDLSPAEVSGLDFVQGDITSLDDVRIAVRGCDAVINTVSIISLNPKNGPLLESVNYRGAENVLKACELEKVPSLVHTSSVDVVFEGKPISNGDESMPYAGEFHDHYSRTKKLGEEAVLQAESPVAKCALRPGGIYGPNDHIRFTSLVEMALKGHYIMIGDSSTRYSHVFAENCAYAHVLAAQQLEKDNSLDGSAYFIVDETNNNFHEFARAVLSKAGLEPRLRKLPVPLAWLMGAFSELRVAMPWTPSSAAPLITRLGVATLSQDFWFSSSKAQSELHYTPLVGVDEAMERTAAWIRATWVDQ